ncbi:hypothetical protein [Photorhabdus africana]|uniref:hypothetical protein n=1 Tax=Photorhabdus africana TaxID=3097554 RepID=UPI002B40748A|nr:hypothetical protein [Photorhabdus sp. CRI-LC]
MTGIARAIGDAGWHGFIIQRKGTTQLQAAGSSYSKYVRWDIYHRTYLLISFSPKKYSL